MDFQRRVENIKRREGVLIGAGAAYVPAVLAVVFRLAVERAFSQHEVAGRRIVR